MTFTIDDARKLTGHTPGPWCISRMSETAVEGPNYRGICSTGGYADNCSDGAYVEQNRANALICRAAADLLALTLSQADEINRLREHAIEREAELIYLRLYGHLGADWAANESKDVWYQRAAMALKGE